MNTCLWTQSPAQSCGTAQHSRLYLRYQLETVRRSGSRNHRRIRQAYQVNLDPNKLRAYNIPLSTVIERVRTSTMKSWACSNGGAQYMIRGLAICVR